MLGGLMNNPLYIGIAVVVLVAIIYFFFFRSSSEGFSDGKKTIILFHLPGCGFCEDMMPEWKKLEQSQSSNPDVDVRSVNCGENPDAAEQNEITGFPTIMLFTDDGDKKIFDGDRTKESFEQFIQAN